jgi:hypothetical protein
VAIVVSATSFIFTQGSRATFVLKTMRLILCASFLFACHHHSGPDSPDSEHDGNTFSPHLGDSNAGTSKLVISNGAQAPVCDVKLGETGPGGAFLYGDWLVCSPAGTMDMSTGISPPPRCYTPCIAPGTSQTFLVKPKRYGVHARVQDDPARPNQGTMLQGDFEIAASVRIVLGVARPYQHTTADGIEFGIGKEQTVAVPAGPEQPCTPSGSEVFDDKRSIHVCN